MEKIGATLHLTEIKAATTFRERLADNLRKIVMAAGAEAVVKMQVIYGGTDPLEVNGVKYVPWREAP